MLESRLKQTIECYVLYIAIVLTEKNIQRPLINQRRPRAGGATWSWWPCIATVTICRFVVAIWVYRLFRSHCWPAESIVRLTSRCEKSETFSSFRHVPVVEHIRFVDSCSVDNVGDPESVQLSSAFLTAVDVFFFFSLGPINVSFLELKTLRSSGAQVHGPNWLQLGHLAAWDTSATFFQTNSYRIAVQCQANEIRNISDIRRNVWPATFGR